MKPRYSQLVLDDWASNNLRLKFSRESEVKSYNYLDHFNSDELILWKVSSDDLCDHELFNHLLHFA